MTDKSNLTRSSVKFKGMVVRDNHSDRQSKPYPEFPSTPQHGTG
jgi:hypothetical protein